MARNTDDEQAPCKRSTAEQEEEDDEALSLSDLPLNLVIEDKSQQPKKETTQVKENEEEFNFDSWGGSLSTESEMCAADEVFFKGQILPLRLSVSSDSGLVRFQHDSRNTSRCISRSESMDHGSSSDMGGLTSINSSRSSSTRSHNSSNSSSSSCSITTTRRNSKLRIRNQFHTFPSPNPQIRVSNARQLGNSSGSRNQKSRTVWDFFNLGLVRAPEIELQDLKVRNNINNSTNKRTVSRNSSIGSSSTNSRSSIKNYNGHVVAKTQPDSSLGKLQKQESFLDKRRGLFDVCKCSITAVETVPLNNIVIIKSTNGSSSSSSNKKNNNESSAVDVLEKNIQELKIKKKMKEKQQGKQSMSRRRTFEWLKELSHASYGNGLET